MLLSLVLCGLLALAGCALYRRATGDECALVCLGAGLPWGVLCLLGLTQLGRYLLPWPAVWMVALGLTLSALVLDRAPRPLTRPPLTRRAWAGLGLLWFLAYMAMHTREIQAPEDDFFVHFPLIALGGRGIHPPPMPFMADLTMFGHFGRDVAIAILSQLNGLQIQPATWAFNHSLQLSALVLAAGLGLRACGSRGAVLLPTFLFLGVSVGSRVGLVDTYDNNNLLVYACLLALLATWERSVEKSAKSGFLLFGLGLGVYAIVYETHMLLLACTCVAYCLLTRRHARGLVLALLAAGLCSALMGGPIQDLLLRTVGARQIQHTHADAYEGQHVQMHVPKTQFLQILLGGDAYRRLSYVYETSLLRNLPPPLDAGGYTFVFHPKVLALHWLGTLLGFPAGFYLLRRGGVTARMLWLFGVVAYLVPAVVDFGPVHEKEYFRWEFAAGFALSGALALALAATWRGAYLPLCLAVLWGGEMRLNQCWILMQRNQRPGLWTPFYPSQDDWLLAQPSLRLSADDLAAAHWLQSRLTAEDRVVTNLEARGQWEFFREATLAGLFGARVVGHLTPPPWMPDGIAPYFHTANWSVFWQQKEPRALAGLRATWVWAEGAEVPGLVPAFTRGNLRLYQAPARNGGPGRVLEPPAWPSPQSLQGEIATPIGGRSDGRLVVRWLPGPQTPLGGAGDDLILEGPGPLYLVPPPVDGDYTVQLLGDLDKVLGEQKLRISFPASVSGLRLNKVVWGERQGEVKSAQLQFRWGEPLPGPLRLGWRIYDLVEKRYQTPYGLDGQKMVWFSDPKTPGRFPLPEEPGGAAKVDLSVRWPDPESSFRIDFFLQSYSGQEVPLGGEYPPP